MNIELQKARVRALASQVANYPHEPGWMTQCNTCLLHHATRIPFGMQVFRPGADHVLSYDFMEFFGLPAAIPMLFKGGPTYPIMFTATGLHIATILLAEIGDVGPPVPVNLRQREEAIA